MGCRKFLALVTEQIREFWNTHYAASVTSHTPAGEIYQFFQKSTSLSEVDIAQFGSISGKLNFHSKKSKDGRRFPVSPLSAQCIAFHNPILPGDNATNQDSLDDPSVPPPAKRIISGKRAVKESQKEKTEFQRQHLASFWAGQYDIQNPTREIPASDVYMPTLAPPNSSGASLTTSSCINRPASSGISALNVDTHQ